MATHRVDMIVSQGYYNIVDDDDSVGTQGCGPCVGIIARLVNGRVFCGHLHSDARLTRKDREEYSNRVRRYLRSILNPNFIQKLCYVTDKVEFPSRFAAEVIEHMFAHHAHPVVYFGGTGNGVDGLFYKGNLIQMLKWQDRLAGVSGAERNPFSL